MEMSWDSALFVRSLCFFTVLLCCSRCLMRLIRFVISSFFRMSVFDRLTSLIPQVSSASRQTKERSPTRPSPPLASPVIRKRPIQIPSFLENRLACDKIGAEQINSSR